MIETKLTQFNGLYKLLGKSEQLTIAIGADATVKVCVGTTRMVIPVQIALALGTKEAQEFLADPVIASYLFAANDRETRVYAADLLLRKEVQDKRRAFVVQFVEAGLVGEQEAWVLARLKYP